MQDDRKRIRIHDVYEHNDRLQESFIATRPTWKYSIRLSPPVILLVLPPFKIILPFNIWKSPRWPLPKSKINDVKSKAIQQKRFARWNRTWFLKDGIVRRGGGGGRRQQHLLERAPGQNAKDPRPRHDWWVDQRIFELLSATTAGLGNGRKRGVGGDGVTYDRLHHITKKTRSWVNIDRR